MTCLLASRAGNFGSTGGSNEWLDISIARGENPIPSDFKKKKGRDVCVCACVRALMHACACTHMQHSLAHVTESPEVSRTGRIQ